MTTPVIHWHLHRHIWLDLDETLASTMSGLITYAHSIGELSHLEDIEDVRKHDASGLGSHITSEEVGRIWEWYSRTTMNPLSVSPLDDALSGVRQLHEIGKDISIVTARSNQESWKVERTLLWVRTHFPFLHEDDIHFVNHFTTDAKPKSIICKELGVSLMIDDAMENAHELCLSGISCILLEKPWNRDIDFEHPLLYRARDWGEIIQSIEN